MHHTLDICQDIAQKLAHPDRTISIVEDAIVQGKYYSNDWQRYSMAYGFAGIAIFYAVMDESFQGENYDKITHEYLKLAVEAFENDEFSTHSLFHGVTGLCAAVSFCSKDGFRYRALTEKLDTMLIQFLQQDFFKYLNFEVVIPPSHYNLTDGLAGILTYISMRKDNPFLQTIAFDCIKKLKFAFKKKQVASFSQAAPGWYVDLDAYVSPDQREKYPQGCFLLDSQYGIAGLLSSLAIAALEGFCPDEGYELIQEMSVWLKNKQGRYASGIFWNHSLGIEEEMNNHILPPELNRDAWCYGIPAVAKALFLAAKALRQGSLATFAEEALVSMWEKPEKEWNQLATSFSYGRAGHLAITYRMAQWTGSRFLRNKLVELEEGLKKFYNPSFPFGFRAVGFSDQGEYMWVDDPSLYSGATGVALSLLLLHKEQSVTWDRLFANA